MKHIILCRHGETEWSRDHKHTSFTDLSLTEKGMAQAKNLEKPLKTLSFDEVYTSPLKRARQTCALANPSNEVLGEPLAVEWNYGDYEGITTKKIREKHPKWNLFFDGAPGGESPDDVGKRADQLIEKWKKMDKNILLFSHGHFLRVLGARWIGLSPKDARLLGLTVASISILGFEREQQVLSSWSIPNNE